METTARCTCHCPDGPGQHLENCETYLQYWELEKLERIALAWNQLAIADPRNIDCIEPLVRETVSFTQSVTSENTSISDPMAIIRDNVKRFRKTMAGLA